MRIFGDHVSSEFKSYDRESRIFFGHNDVLKGEKQICQRICSRFFTSSDELVTVEPKLYLHIPTNAWTTFTAKLREYCLPWRWKTAYLDRNDGAQPCRILVCTCVQEGKLSYNLSKVVGKSWFLTNLISQGCYHEILGQEFLRLKDQKPLCQTQISHPLGKIMGSYCDNSKDLLYHIYRPRSLFSILKYCLLNQFSANWQEVSIQTKGISEKILVQKSDIENIYQFLPQSVSVK